MVQFGLFEASEEPEAPQEISPDEVFGNPTDVFPDEESGENDSEPTEALEQAPTPSHKETPMPAEFDIDRVLNLSDDAFAAVVKAREEKKKEGLKAKKLDDVKKSLNDVSYDDLEKVEAFIRRGFKAGKDGAQAPKAVGAENVPTAEDIFQYLQEAGTKNATEVRAHFGVKTEKGEKKVSALLKKLRDGDKIKGEGKARATKYSVA